MSATLLTVGIGDIHGRFHRVQTWLADLEQALGRRVDLALAVGDVEAFAQPDDHRRKAAKRNMPAEFSEYASGEAKQRRPLYFIGGNNEDFEALHPHLKGADLAPDVHYLGRVGRVELGGLKIAFLSGIFAPKHFELPLEPPRNRETSKQAGYFRKPEVDALSLERDVDLMLVHEWPRGLFAGQKPPGGPQFRPWIGNRVTQQLVASVKPRWLWCGHSHLPWAATLSQGREVTRVACLDQAAKPESAIFWVEWQGREAKRAGWGTDGRVAWEAGQPWNATRLPAPEPFVPSGVEGQT